MSCGHVTSCGQWAVSRSDVCHSVQIGYLLTRYPNLHLGVNSFSSPVCLGISPERAVNCGGGGGRRGKSLGWVRGKIGQRGK